MGFKILSQTLYFAQTSVSADRNEAHNHQRFIHAAVIYHIMTDTNNNIILTTKPSIRAIGFGLVGALFFGAFVYLMTSWEWTVADGTDYKTGMIIMWITLGVFVFFTLACLWSILTIKTIVLTSNTLIIKRPFLLLKKTVPIDNIRQVTESTLKINPTVRWTTYNVYDGKKILIEFFQGKSILLNSFEIVDFYNLTMQLNKLRYNKNNNFDDFNKDLKNENQGYGWLVVISLLTIGLIYSIIRQKL